MGVHRNKVIAYIGSDLEPPHHALGKKALGQGKIKCTAIRKRNSWAARRPKEGKGGVGGGGGLWGGGGRCFLGPGLFRVGGLVGRVLGGGSCVFGEKKSLKSSYLRPVKHRAQKKKRKI